MPHNAELEGRDFRVRASQRRIVRGRERSFDAYVSHNCEGEKKKRIIFSLQNAMQLSGCLKAVNLWGPDRKLLFRASDRPPIVQIRGIEKMNFLLIFFCALSEPALDFL